MRNQYTRKVDNEEVWAFAEAICGHASHSGVFAFDAVFGDNEGHRKSSKICAL